MSKISEYAKIITILNQFQPSVINIKDIHINKDFTVDVDDSVDFSTLKFKNIPVNFNHVEHDFNLCGCDNLTSLEGCPKYVGWTFSIAQCKNLKYIKYFPSSVRDIYLNIDILKNEYSEENFEILCNTQLSGVCYILYKESAKDFETMAIKTKLLNRGIKTFFLFL